MEKSSPKRFLACIVQAKSLILSMRAVDTSIDRVTLPAPRIPVNGCSLVILDANHRILTKNGPDTVEQASLLQLLSGVAPTPYMGLAGLMPEIRAQMNRVAALYAPGRKLLVDAINAVAEQEGISLTSGGGKRILIDQLDKWLQPHSKGHAPTFEAVLCFCIALKDYSPLAPLFDRLGLTVIPKSESRYLELGKAQAEFEAARSRLKTAKVKI